MKAPLCLHPFEGEGPEGAHAKMGALSICLDLTMLRTMLRRHLLLALAPLFLAFLPRSVLANDPVEFGRAAAAQWLPLVDAAQAEASWNITASGFRRAITLAQWSHVLSTQRWPLGGVKSRQEVEARSATSLPGAPDGQYVLIRYQVVFENKAEATEALTIVLDADGVWRITGYFIR